jgi:hypothetical protein
MRLDNSLADRQTQTTAALSIGCTGSIKLFEYVGQLFRWNTNPSIYNSNLGACAASTRTDLNRCVGFGIFDGVIEQVDKDLREECEIHRNHRKVIREIDKDRARAKLLA